MPQVQQAVHVRIREVAKELLRRGRAWPARAARVAVSLPKRSGARAGVLERPGGRRRRTLSRRINLEYARRIPLALRFLLQGQQKVAALRILGARLRRRAEGRNSSTRAGAQTTRPGGHAARSGAAQTSGSACAAAPGAEGTGAAGLAGAGTEAGAAARLGGAGFAVSGCPRRTLRSSHHMVALFLGRPAARRAASCAAAGGTASGPPT